MGCNENTPKHIIWLFNVILTLCGIALLLLGVIYQLKFTDIIIALESTYVNAAPIFIFVVSSVALILSIYCALSILRNRWDSVIVYSGFFVIVILLQICLSITAFAKVNQDEFKTNIINDLNLEKQSYLNGDETNFDLLQTSLECCGVESYNDWPAMPKSCCMDGKRCLAESPEMFKEGCADKLDDVLKTDIQVMASCTLILSLVELASAIVAIFARRKWKNIKKLEMY